MEINTMTQFIAQLGFPIFICVWMLHKSQRDDLRILTALNQLETAIKELRTYIETVKEAEKDERSNTVEIIDAIKQISVEIKEKWDTGNG